MLTAVSVDKGTIKKNQNLLIGVTFWVRLKYDKYSMFSSANLQMLPA